MNLANRGPMGQKAEKLPEDPAYLARVRQRPCVRCGKHGPNEAHHCRDLPDYNERGLYKRLPGAALRSHDHDAIPLCQECHWLFHNRRSEFHATCGRDYSHIGPTRAALRHGEIDY